MSGENEFIAPFSGKVNPFVCIRLEWFSAVLLAPSTHAHADYTPRTLVARCVPRSPANPGSDSTPDCAGPSFGSLGMVGVGTLDTPPPNTCNLGERNEHKIRTLNFFCKVLRAPVHVTQSHAIFSTCGCKKTRSVGINSALSQEMKNAPSLTLLRVFQSCHAPIHR